MSEAKKLQWNRKARRMNVKEYAKLVNLSPLTIDRLERDDMYWCILKPEERERIYSTYQSMASWQPDKEEAKQVIQEIKDDEEEPIEVIEEIPIHETISKLDVNDAEILTLIEFAYEGLKESSTHEEFEANLKIIKRIISKY